MTNSNSCTASFTQMACIEALKGPQDAVKKMVAEFKKRRDVIVDGLKAQVVRNRSGRIGKINRRDRASLLAARPGGAYTGKKDPAAQRSAAPSRAAQRR